MLPHLAMEQIALFVSRGQIDMDLYVDRETKKSRGDPSQGASYYQTICAVCHGFDGKRMNFGTPEDPEYVGTVAPSPRLCRRSSGSSDRARHDAAPRVLEKRLEASPPRAEEARLDARSHGPSRANLF